MFTNHLKIKSLLLLLFILVSALVPVYAESSQADTGITVRMGYFEEEGLMNGAEEGAVKSGYAYEYIQEVAAQAGWKYEYVYGTFPELYQMLISGEIDALPYITGTEERAKLMLFPNNSMGVEQYFLASLAPLTLSDDFHELQGKNVGTIKDAFQNKAFNDLKDEKNIDCQLKYYMDSESMWQAMVDGEIDFSIESDMIYQNISIYSVCQFGPRSPYYLAISKGREDLLEQLNSAQQRIYITNPSLTENLKKKYFGALPIFRRLPDYTKEWMESHDTIRLGCYSRNTPYVIDNKNGSVSGVLPDSVDLMFEAIGLEKEIEWFFYSGKDEALNALKAGEIDCINPYYHNYNDAEADGVIISNPMHQSTMSVLYQGAYTAETMERVACVDTRLGAGYVRDNYPEAVVVGCADIVQCFDKLIAGEVNSIISNASALEAMAKNYKQDFNIKALTVNCQVCFAALPENSELISVFNKVIPYVTDVQRNAIQNKYNVATSTRTSQSIGDFIMDNPLYFTGLLVLVLMIIVFILVEQRRRDMENERKLQAAMEKAEEANRAKTSFLFNMSHDIRTPMNAILGFTDMAKKNVNNPDKLTDCLNKTQQAGNLLLSLINSVLEMSRIESGKAELDEEPGMVDYSFESIKSTMQVLAKEKNIDLSFEIGHIDDHYVFVDIDRCNRVFINIISNGIKYTHEGGWVKVSCEQVKREDNKGFYRYTFEDNGIGMSSEFQEKLFDEFSREKNTTASGVQGSGLGLSVAKSFVTLMGGTIECRSRQGVGTSFIVTLPLRLQTDEKTIHYIEPGTKKLVDVHPQADSKTAASLVGKRVLLVEDNELNREIAGFILEEQGVIYEEADDGNIAVEMVREKGPDYYDAILMDIQMPTMSGYDATKAIRAMFPHSELPIIAVSANAFTEDRVESLAVGMNAHIAKPIDAQELKSTMERLIK